MAPTLAEVVRHFMADVGKALSATLIAEWCRALKHAWRERTLDPVTTIRLFLTQIPLSKEKGTGTNGVNLAASPWGDLG